MVQGDARTDSRKREDLVDGPEAVELELGFSLKGQVSALIAETAAEGSSKRSLKWKPYNDVEPQQ
jgi:hypothetical protein